MATDFELARQEAFSEYYKLAIRPCTNPTKADLEPLEKAIKKYEAICNRSENDDKHTVNR